VSSTLYLTTGIFSRRPPSKPKTQTASHSSHVSSQNVKTWHWTEVTESQEGLPEESIKTLTFSK